MTDLWAFIATGKDGEEGIMAMSMPLAQMGGNPTMMPMIAADQQRLDQMKPFAELISKATKTPYTLKHYKLVE